MRPLHILSIVLPLVLPCRGALCAHDVTVTIDPETEYQTVDGFGVSGAWWVTWFSQLPEETRAECLRLLFTDAGAGIDIYRYNIPAGSGDDVTIPSRRTPDLEIEPQRYDFSRDKAGLDVARAVRTLGVTRFVAFSNSPPARMTINGMPSGGPRGGPNLRPDSEDGFAGYLADVGTYLLDELDLETIRVSPINEPQWDWGGPRRHQEGCHYEPEQAVRVVRALLEEVDRRGLAVTVEAPESGAWNRSIEFAGPMFSDPLIAEKVHAFAQHSYWSDASQKRAFRAWMDEHHPGVGIAMSEYCEMRGDRDLGMRSGLHVARVIHDDMTIGRVTEWHWWLALAGGRYCDGLIDITPQRPEIRTTKRLWVLAHWARFVEPGSIRVGAACDDEALLVSAYRLAGDADRYALVMVNPGDEACALSLGEDWSVQSVYVTDEGRDLERTEPGESGVVVPQRGVVTVLFTR